MAPTQGRLGSCVRLRRRLHGAVLLGAGVMLVTKKHLSHVDDEETPAEEAADEAVALTVGSDT